MRAEKQTSFLKPVTIKRFTPSEDQIIMSLAKPDSENDWCKISKSLVNRTARQCRDRWNNYLNPNLNKKAWNQEEDELLLKLYNEKGPQWKHFCAIFNGRSINDVRNRCFKLLRRSQKFSKNSSKVEKPIDKKADNNDDYIDFDVDNFPIEDESLQLNIFDNEIISNFDSMTFDFDELCQEF